MINFTITKCDLNDIINEIVRFISHITILHLLTYFTGDEKEQLFNELFLNTVLFSIMAVIIYHIFLKKIYIPTFKKN